MIRYLRALVWLRWRLILNALRASPRRDGWERLSRIFQAVAPVLFLLFFLPFALVLGVLGLAGGWVLATPGTDPEPILITIRVLVGFAAMVMLLSPLFRVMQGSTPNLTRLLLLPIPARTLYLCEASSAFADPWLAVMLPGILLLPAGLAGAGRPGGAVVSLLGGAALLALLAGIGAVATSVASLLFRDRRRGEVLSVILIVLFVAVSILPGFFIAESERAKEGGRTRPTLEQTEKRSSEPGAPGPARRIRLKILSGWTAAFPPELYVRSVALAASGRSGAALAPLGILAAVAAGCHLIGWRAYRRLLDSPAISARRRGALAGRSSGRVLPGLGPASSAVALAHARLAMRTVQGKIAFYVTPVIVLAVGGVLRQHPEEIGAMNLPAPPGALLAFVSILFSLLTLDAVLLNQFAIDRAGLTLQFLAPISDREIVRGKAAGNAILSASRAAIGLGIAALLVPGGSPLLWLAAVLAGVGIFAILAPTGALISAMLPRAGDLNRIGSAGKPHPLAGLLGMLALVGASVPISGPAAIVLVLWRSPALALVVVSVLTAGCLLVSAPLFRLAETSLAARRENLLLVALGR
jgi:hypothetical protein